MSEAEDRLLVETVLSGDPYAFRPFILKYQRLVGTIVSRMVANRADREDVGQDIFLKLYRHLASFQFNAKLSTWVATVAYNTCLHYLQKKRIALLADLQEDEEADPFAAVADALPDPARRYESKELSERIQRAIAGLPPVYATVLSLYHVQEMKYQEIAQVMQLPEGTVKSYLFRARSRIKRHLAGLQGEEA